MTEEILQEATNELVEEGVKTLPFGKTTLISAAGGFVAGVITAKVAPKVAGWFSKKFGDAKAHLKKDSKIVDVEATEVEDTSDDKE